MTLDHDGSIDVRSTGAWGRGLPSAPRGCVFYAFGAGFMLRLLVAVHSLRRHYAGPIAVVFAGKEQGAQPLELLRELGCEIAWVDALSQSRHRQLIFRGSPYDATLSLDVDMIFRSSIDPLWAPLEEKGLLVTRFHPEPFGVGGTAARPGWGDRVGMLSGIRGLLGDALYATVRRRMLDEHIDVNIGVFGIARPNGDAFLDDFCARMDRGHGSRMILLDELLVSALIDEHPHHLAEERWNCPADRYFRRSQLEDAAIVHYFADGHAVAGTHLGRNPATPAGRLWFEALEAASRDLALDPWIAADRTLADHVARARAASASPVTGQPAVSPAAPTAQRAPAAAGKGSHDRSGATVVLMSYRRPQNIDRILQAVVQCEFVREIILSNNNPEVRMADHLRVQDDRLRIIEQPQRCYPAIRFELSREASCHWMIAIDDDIFPSPDQIRALYDALRTEPRIPHGFGGQWFRLNAGRPRIQAVENRNLAVEALVWIFAYSQDHLRRYFELLASADLDTERLRFNEDVPLSFAGTAMARAHYVGPITFCDSASEPGVAYHTESGFMRQRYALVARMRALTGREGGG